jgi:hypothetical protein
LIDVILYCGENWRITNGIVRAYDGRDGRKSRCTTIRGERADRNMNMAA